MKTFSIAFVATEEQLGPIMANLVPHIQHYTMELILDVPFTKNAPRKAKAVRGEGKKKSTSRGSMSAKVENAIKSLASTFTVPELMASMAKKNRPRNVYTILRRLAANKVVKKTGGGSYEKVA